MYNLTKISVEKWESAGIYIVFYHFKEMNTIISNITLLSVNTFNLEYI